METDFRDALFEGEPAEISLSSSSFLIRSENRQLQIPTAKVIAINVTDSEKATSAPNRVKANVLILEDFSKAEGNSPSEKDQPPKFKHYEIEYTRREKPPSSPLSLPQLPDHLLLPPSQNSQPNIHIIISTSSGTHKAASFFDQCLKPLLDHLKIPAYDIHRTESPDTISQLTRDFILPRANQGVKQLIILLSGDGGIVDIVNTLLSEEKPLKDDAVAPVVALIPMGTGNALFNSSCRGRRHPAMTAPSPSTETSKSSGSLVYHEDQTAGLRSLLFGTPKPLPTLSVTFSPGSTLVTYPSTITSSSSSSTTIMTTTPTHKPLPFQPPSSSSSSTTTTPPTLHASVLLSWCLHASLISLSDHPSHRTQGSSRFTTAAKALLYPEDGSPAHIYRGVVSTLRSNPDSSSSAGRRMEEEEEEEEEWIPLRDDDDKGAGVRKAHMYVLCTLVRELEDGFAISPASGPVDGKAWLVSVGGDVGVGEVVAVLGEAWSGGGHVKREGVVGYEEVEGVRVEFEEEEEEDDEDDDVLGGGEGGDGSKGNRGRWRRVCVDGLVVECPRGGWVEARKDRDKGARRRAIDLVVM